MGYYSRVSGKINIVRLTPPEIPDDLLEQIEKYGLKIESQYRGLSPDAVDKISNLEYLHGYVEVYDRYLIGTNEDNKVYWLEEGLREALKIIEADGCYPSGFLVVAGEESGDITRYLIVDGKDIRHEEAILSWPDGTRVEI
jgi:hypothetical protein